MVDLLNTIYNSANNYDGAFDGSSSRGFSSNDRNTDDGSFRGFNAFTNNDTGDNESSSRTFGNRRTAYKIQDSGHHDNEGGYDEDASMFSGSVPRKGYRKRVYKSIGNDTDNFTTGIIGTDSTKSVVKRTRSNISKKKKAPKKKPPKAPRKKAASKKRKRRDEDDESEEDSAEDDDDDDDDAPSPIRTNKSDSNLAPPDTRLSDEDLTDAYGTMTDEQREMLRQVLDENSHGDFRRFVDSRHNTPDTEINKPPVEETIITTRTSQKAMSLDEMQCDLVYHKKNIHDRMQTSIKKVKNNQITSTSNASKRSLSMLIREEIPNHSTHCHKYIALLSVTPKAPRSRGIDLIFGSIETEEERRALNSKCTCNPGIEDVTTSGNTEAAMNNSSSSSSSSSTSTVQQIANVVTPVASTTDGDALQIIPSPGGNTQTPNSNPQHPDINQLLQSPESQKNSTPIPNLSKISPELISYVQSEFGEFMDLAHMDIGTFLSKTCPLCLYGGYSAKGSIYMEAVEQIKSVYRIKAFSSDHSTLAIKLCTIWNSQIFLPLIEKGVQILPCLYEVILDHIKRPHVIDATLIAKSEVDDISSMQMGLKQLIFYRVKVVEKEIKPAKGGKTSSGDSMEEQSDTENINEIESSSSSSSNSSSSSSTDSSMESESSVQQKRRKITRVTESTRYNPAAMRDFVMLSRLKLSWLHSKRTDTVFNTQGRTKRKDVFNPHNANTTITL